MRRFLRVMILPLLAGTVSSSIAQPPYQVLPDRYGESCKGSIGFWENKGQICGQQQQPVPGCAFYTQGAYPLGYFFRGSKFSVVVKEPTTGTGWLSHRIDVRPHQADSVDPVGQVVKSYYKNFYLPWTVPGGVENVQGYERITYPEIYQNIDMHFYSGSAGQKIAFHCWPGSDPTKLALEFNGQDSLRVDDMGDLKVWLSGRWVRLEQAVAYQVGTGNEIIPINWAAYEHVEGSGVVQIIFDTYDENLPLVLQIGPTPLAAAQNEDGLCWSTYYGGSGSDQILASTIDPDGNYYVTGYAGSDFLTFQDAVGTDYLQLDNAIPVVKFNDHTLWSG